MKILLFLLITGVSANTCVPCLDTDNGAIDSYGDNCEGYTEYPSWCNGYDDADFTSGDMCCGCGGGATKVCTDGFVDDECICCNTLCQTGEFCYSEIGGGLCRDSLLQHCTNTDGSTATNNECACNNIVCQADEICLTENGGGSCRNSVTNEFVYPLQTAGQCDTVVGEEACLNAALSLSLGLSVTEPIVGSYNNIPPGCIGNFNNLFYNHYDASTIACSNILECICFAAPDCQNIDGTIVNDKTCTCGNTGCSVETGLFCNELENHCSSLAQCTYTDGSVNTEACTCGTTDCDDHCYGTTCSEYTECSVFDGSAANEGPCLCGNTECTQETGLICFSAGDGSCRKSDVGPFGYQILKSGHCDVIISSPSECRDAVERLGYVRLGLLTNSPLSITSSDYSPPGCYTYENLLGETLLYYNDYASEESCHYDEECICLVVPDCQNIDGTIVNDKTCTCGNTGCSVETGLFCNELENHCSSLAQCTYTDGSVNTEACTCGNEECTEETGLICYSETGGGSCRASDPGAYGYPLISSGSCDNVGRSLSSADCESAANSLDYIWGGTIGGNWVSSAPLGCFRSGDRLYYNTYEETTETCNSDEQCVCLAAPDCLDDQMNEGPCLCGDAACGDSSGFYCHASDNVCSVNPPCSVTDGSVANTDACTCGNEECPSGLYCHASDNVCSVNPPCSVTDGSVANTDSCRCGNEECTEETGLICYSETGGGSCRKNDVGAFGYPFAYSGLCTDVAGRKIISDKAACEEAATRLGLSVVVASISNDYDEPRGCYWRNDRLKYNEHTTSTAECDAHSDYCICVAGCDPGFHSDGDTCVANNCECPNGILNTGTCTSDGAHFCESCNTGHYLYKQSCYACRPGTYQDQADCIVCEVDAFSPAGETTCDYTVNTCPVGTYASGTASCTSCAAGKYNDQTGKTSEADCKSCADGQYSAPGEEVCSHSTCPKGTDGTDGQCTPCTAGKYNDKPGQACEVCHDTTDIMTKKHSTVGQSSCVYTVMTCPAGTYAVTSTQSCENCPVGKYSEQQGRMSASHCTACAVGTYNSKTGQNAQSACKNCGSGKTSSVNNDDCEACAAGKYSDASCKDCSAGRFSGQAADSCTDCNVGTYSPLGASDCEYTVTTCPAGTYATSTAACEQCPSGYYSQTGQSCTGCESGKFSSAGQSHCNPPTQKTSGKCTIPLTTADICLEAAQALILTGIQSSLYGTSRSATDVPGCTYDSFWAEYGIGMKFNINPDSTGDCTQGKTCICLKPVCTCLNGTPESEACTEDGAEHCKTCDDGFDLDENNACVDIDDCASDPCQNGGTCTDKVNAFSCACASGYEGDTCVTDIDECATSPTSPTSPCDANADCANNVGSYTCTCMDGYHGSGVYVYRLGWYL